MSSSDAAAAPAGPVVRGPVVRPGDAGFDTLRVVHNAMVDRRPGAIVRATDAADVACTVAYAAEHGVPLTVRAGGHSAAGHSAADGGITLDLRALDRVIVDPAAMTVSVEGGATMAQADAAAQAHGLAFTGARVSSVGVAGFTTGSGSGWLERAFGLASDTLASARVVTAFGEEVVASASEHADLFFALRGGGGNFGVVTELTFRATPLGPQVVGGLRGFPFARADEVLTAYATVLQDAPDALCGALALTTAPPLSAIPAALHGTPIVLLVALWAGDPADAAEGLKPLDALGTPLVDHVAPMPYATGIQRLFEQGPPRDLRSYLKFGVADAPLGGDAIATLCTLGAELTPGTSILVQPLGGAVARVPHDATALGDRDARWAYQLLSAWPDAEQDASNIAWARAAAAELAAHTRPSSWPNYVADRGRAGALAVPYAPDTLARLREVKRAWDPDNLFRANHNVAPA